jgi:hypothetical protein
MGGIASCREAKTVWLAENSENGAQNFYFPLPNGKERFEC